MITTLLLLALAGVFNAIMDGLKHHYYDGVFDKIGEKHKWFHYWAAPGSYKNKYKSRDPKQGPAFFGSTTIFVFTTDAWHFFQMLWRTSFTLAVKPHINTDTVWDPMYNFTLFSILYLVMFNVFYEYLLRKTK